MLGTASVARNRSRHRVASSTFYVLLSFAFGVMLDLDRPKSGKIVIMQEPFDRAVQSITKGDQGSEWSTVVRRVAEGPELLVFERVDP